MSKRAKRTQYGVQAVKQKLRGIEPIILEGRLIAIDPSCISVSSLPGYAIFSEGELVESGVISGISPAAPLEVRLQFLGKYCREEFEEPDVLVVEHIQMGGRINMQSTIRAVGAIIGNFECEHVISVSPLAWQKYIEKRIPLGGGTDYLKYQEYKKNVKSDAKDAEMLGFSVIYMARENLD